MSSGDGLEPTVFGLRQELDVALRRIAALEKAMDEAYRQLEAMPPAANPIGYAYHAHMAGIQNRPVPPRYTPLSKLPETKIEKRIADVTGLRRISLRARRAT